MAKYTMTIKTMIDNNFDFGLNDYPIFNETYRSILNKNILDYYFESEIGFETPALFKHYLNSKMRLIMTKYNALYQAQEEVLKNLLNNVNLEETYTRNTNTSANSNSLSDGKNLFQDTPQGRINFVELEQQQWATTFNMNKINDESTSTGEGLETFTRNIKGNNGNKYSVEVFKEIYSNFLNIDMLIIDELQELFMGLL